MLFRGGLGIIALQHSKMAANEELKECLRMSIANVLDRLNDRLYEDMDGIDYLCVQVDRIQNLAQRASALYNIPTVVVDTLRRAHDSLKLLATGNEDISLFTSTGCRGRPAVHIPEDLLQLYLDYQFPLGKIGEMFGVSSKTIQRRIAEYDLRMVDFVHLTDNELDNQM